MKNAQLYYNIGELMTLKGAYRKQGRFIQDNDLGVVKNAALVVEQGRVVWAGLETRCPKQLKIKKSVDCQKLNIFPGFIDCHTHMIFAGDRRHEFELRNKGMSYQEIAQQGGGILSTVKATRRASLDQLIDLGQQRVSRHLQQGVTTIEIKSGYGLDAKTEIKMLQAAQSLKGPHIVTTFLGAHALPKTYQNEAAYLARLEKDLLTIKKLGLSQRVDIFVEKGYFSTKAARSYLSKAKALGFDITIHAEQMSRSGGALLAVEMGARSADHLICSNDSDKDKMAQAKDFTSVLLPNADLYLKCPYPDARGFLDRGGRVALATDYNPGSSPTQSLALVGLLARLEMKMSLSEVFVALTLGGSYALGLENDRGALLPGMSADFFMSPMTCKDFFYDLSSHQVQNLFVKGKQIYKDEKPKR